MIFVDDHVDERLDEADVVASDCDVINDDDDDEQDDADDVG